MNPDAIMNELRAMAGQGLDRVEECLRILAGQQAPVYLHDEQEPTRLFFPGIAAQPWHDAGARPWTAAVEEAFPQIREEFLGLRAQAVRFAPYEDLYTKELGWRGWDTYQLYRNGAWRPQARELCPKTCAALELTPHGPRDGMFTILHPGVRLTPHTGGVNLLLTAHLPLIVPPGCALKVCGEERSWHEGEVLLFDDSFIHEAWNSGPDPRAVLLWDIWHPDLTPTEVRALEILLPRFQQYLMAA